MRRMESPPPRCFVRASRSLSSNGKRCFATQTSIVTEVSDSTRVVAWAGPMVRATVNAPAELGPSSSSVLDLRKPASAAQISGSLPLPMLPAT